MRINGKSYNPANDPVLAKIVKTFTSRYPIKFVWCKSREDLRNKMCLWFAHQMGEN